MRPFFAIVGWSATFVSVSLLLSGCGASIPKEPTVAPDPPFVADEPIVVECSDELLRNTVLHVLKQTYGDQFHIRVTFGRVERGRYKENPVHMYAWGSLSSGNRVITLKRWPLGMVTTQMSGYATPSDIYSYEICAKEIAMQVLENTRRIPLTRYAPSQRGIREIKEREWQERLQALKNEKKAMEQSLVAEKKQELMALQTPRGEFESTAEYQARMAQAKSQRREIEQRYAAKLEAEQASIDREIEGLLASTVTEITLWVGNIGTYDADRGTFPVTIWGRTEKVAVPREVARLFKEGIDKLVVKGERRLTVEGQWTVYNVMIENPATGNRYAFGPQTERRVAVTRKIVPPKLVARRPQFLEPSGNGFLDAEEEGKVVLTVENKGEGSAYSLLVQLSAQGSTPHVTYDKERIISEIRPGTRETVQLSLRAGSSVADGQYSFVLNMKEANGFEPEEVPFSIQTRHLIPPDLQVVDIGVRDASQNSKIEPGELASITVRVQNRGKGEAKAVQARVVLGENVFFTQESQKQFDLGNIPAGAYKDVVFSLYTNNRIKDQIPVSLRLTEQRDRFSKREPLALSVNRVQKRPEEIVFTGQAKPEAEIKDVATLSVDIERNIPKTKMQNPNAVAVVIGNQHYKHIGNVDYANRDATVMRDYLEQTFGYKAGNILHYTDATKTDFEALFGSHADHKGKLYRKTRTGGEVFIYYSGHGHSEGQDKPSYFVPADAEVATIGLTGYPLKVFYDNIAKLIAEKNPKRVVVVIESCFSGYLAEGISSTRWVSDNPLETLKDRGAVVMTAASGRETAKWYKAKQHGLFTYFLLKAFQNSPNEDGKRADANGDGQLTLSEIQAFVGDRNYGVPYFAPLQTGDEQTPVIMGDKSTVFLEW